VISLSAPSFINYISPGFGMDMKINSSFFVPLAFHYDYYMAGSGVSQSALRLNVGAGFLF
jgi:hypothetical protein